MADVWSSANTQYEIWNMKKNAEEQVSLYGPFCCNCHHHSTDLVLIALYGLYCCFMVGIQKCLIPSVYENLPVVKVFYCIFYRVFLK